MLQNFKIYNKTLLELSEGKKLITTINTHSYNVTLKDEEFRNVLMNCEILIPDGISIVWAIKLLLNSNGRKKLLDELKYKIKK